MLTEEQISLLRPRWNYYPERRAVITAYPPPRRKRGLKGDEQAALAADEPDALPQGGLSGAPTSRIWSVGITTQSAQSYIVRGSPPFTGPALLHSFSGGMDVQFAAAGTAPIQVAYHSAPYSDVNSGATLIKIPGTHVGTPSGALGTGGLVVNLDSGFLLDQGNISGQMYIPLGIYITLPRFYLGVAVFTTAAVSSMVFGTFRVIENAPPESVGWL